MLRLTTFLLLLLFSAATLAGDDIPVTVEVKPVKLSPHSYYVEGLAGAASSENQGFMSNAGFVVTPGGVVVFDTLGSPPLATELIRQIRKITTQPIRLVIVSHYHADHIYGLQAFKALGAEIWAHQRGREYLASDEATNRLAQRRESLFPWIDETTRLLPADKWLDGDTSFEMGGLHFDLVYMGPAHSPEDMAMIVKEDKVLYSGDLVFTGRVPFVGNADSKAWLNSLDRLLKLQPKTMVPGHGKVSTEATGDLALTRDYLRYLRETMGKAVASMEPFEEAYARTSWKKFEQLPAFQAANRVNAYNTYLLMESEGMQKK
ncbi:beta-lactamase [Sulfuricella sp. T08]|uniref:MBL fold metallo-hydrolase n=1 Tax=Sulfuricella sp. T08 TaxID=1632857 RepID=UPI00061797CA|nr:MBL fold metallo-hydrolase [Sulfuricella sp. T08]GAO36956.1 beta-lactamase [Sulfuricella sp. T08]